MSAPDPNDFRQGDSDNNLLRKILTRLKGAFNIGPITLEPGDIEIGAVELKDASTDNRASIDGSGALLVNVDNFPAGGAVDVSDRAGRLLGHTTVDNFPATQPVSGTVAVSNFPATQPISAVSLPLPTGAATEATLATRVADATITARLGTLGQKTMAGSAPVVIASDQSAVPVSGTVAVSNFPATQPVSGTVTANQGTPNSAANSWPVEVTDGTNILGTPAHPVRTDPTGSTVQPVSGTFFQATQPVSSTQLPAALVGGRLDENVGAWLGSTAPTVGQKTQANSVPVTIASDQTSLPVTVGNFPATQPVSGTVAVSNFPATQVVAGAKSNNAAVPGSTNLGVLPAVANAAPPAWTETFEVTLSEDLAGNLRTINPVQLPSALVGGRLDTNLGSWLGSTAPTVGQKTSANSVPVVIASDQSAIAVTATLGGSKSNNAVVPGATNLGVLPAVANAAAPTWTETFQVTLSEDLSGNLRTINPVQLPAALVGGRLDTNIGSWLGSTAPTVGQKTAANSVPVVLASDQSTVNVQGAKTNNNAAPGATNVGVLPAIANAAAPTWTEGDQVLLSEDLGGGLRVTGTKTNNTAAPAANAQSVLSAVANAAPPTWTEGFVVDQSVDLSGNLRVVAALNQGKTINRFVLAQGSTPGTTQIAAANGTLKNKIVGAFFTMNQSGTAKFTATADLTGAMDVILQGGFVLPCSLPNIWIETPVNQALSIVTTGGGANGVILYIVEA